MTDLPTAGDSVCLILPTLTIDEGEVNYNSRSLRCSQMHRSSQQLQEPPSILRLMTQAYDKFSILNEQPLAKKIPIEPSQFMIAFCGALAVLQTRPFSYHFWHPVTTQCSSDSYHLWSRSPQSHQPKAHRFFSQPSLTFHNASNDRVPHRLTPACQGLSKPWNPFEVTGIHYLS